MTPLPLQLSTTLASQELFSSVSFLILSLAPMPLLHCFHPQQYWRSNSKLTSQKGKTGHPWSRQQTELQAATQHWSVKLASNINWLCVWETAWDKSPYWTQNHLVFLPSSHTPSVRRTLLSKVLHHNTKWDLLVWTSGGVPLPLM